MMTQHDPLCPWPDSGDVSHCDPCGLIERARLSERGSADKDWNRASLVAEGIQYETGYREGMMRAAQVVIDYSEKTHEGHGPNVTCLRCDITAALRVAASEIRKKAQP